MQGPDFSYSAAPSSTNPVDSVRSMIGDVEAADFIFTNSEIKAVIALQPILTYAAAALAEMAAARFARKPDIQSGQTKVSNSQIAANFTALAARLRMGGAGNLPGGDGSGVATASWVVGGIDKDERDALDTDDNSIQPSFSIGMDDKQGTLPDGTLERDFEER